MSNEEFDRRPNPKGWTPPKAPYNPYDPNDIRPAGGYPSEFKLPGQAPSGFSSLPRSPTQYQKVNETMTRLNYTARPLSDLYPGQYKVLRRVDTNRRLNLGSKYFTRLIVGGVIVYGVFLHRWDSENVFSDFYRFHLKLKEGFFGLKEQEYDDLYHPRGKNYVLKAVPDEVYIPEELRKTKENEYNLNKPSQRHLLEAERIQQEREESMLRDLVGKK